MNIPKLKSGDHLFILGIPGARHVLCRVYEDITVAHVNLPRSVGIPVKGDLHIAMKPTRRIRLTTIPHIWEAYYYPDLNEKTLYIFNPLSKRLEINQKVQFERLQLNS